MEYNNNIENKPIEFDDGESSWDSFIEIISSGLRIGVFCCCIYILKEICVLAYEIHCCLRDMPMDCVVIQAVTAGILIILAISAFVVMYKN